MMNSQTEYLLKEAKQLPLSDLKAFTQQLLEEIEDKEWERVFQSEGGTC
jgi:hypothetical protein